MCVFLDKGTSASELEDHLGQAGQLGVLELGHGPLLQGTPTGPVLQRTVPAGEAQEDPAGKSTFKQYPSRGRCQSTQPATTYCCWIQQPIHPSATTAEPHAGAGTTRLGGTAASDPTELPPEGHQRAEEAAGAGAAGVTG